MGIASGVSWNGLPKNAESARSIGESKLKAKEGQLLAREAASAEYASARRAVHENMARLMALRLARDAMRAIAPVKPVELVPEKKRKRRSDSVPAVT